MPIKELTLYKSPSLPSRSDTFTYQ